MNLELPGMQSIKKLWHTWNLRKLHNAKAALDELKLCYHTFRVLLSNNERCLDLLNNLDIKIQKHNQPWPGLIGEAEELLHVTYEMVDALNRLSEQKYQGLYNRHLALAHRVRHILHEADQTETKRPICVSLAQAATEERTQVGGKAAALGRLMAMGMPVPDGFVITVSANRAFLVKAGVHFNLRNRLREVEANPADSMAIRKQADAIRNDILEAEIPAEIAQSILSAYASMTANGEPPTPISLRSSAAMEDSAEHSFAGQFTSVLNVLGEPEILKAYKTVLASNFNARSLAYRLHQHLPLGELDMAVICQRMVPASAAGVLFTLDPTDPKKEHALLSAVPGLGLSAVDGDAPTDIYRPTRTNSRKPLERSIAVKTERLVGSPEGGLTKQAVPPDEVAAPLLTDEQVQALAGYGQMAESLFDGPQDMEWALDDTNSIWVLQSRPMHLGTSSRGEQPVATGQLLLSGGIASSNGRGIGVVRIIRNAEDLEQPPKQAEIAVLHQSLVQAARWLPLFQGVVVELGNPADHLSSVAREYGTPMLTGVTGAAEVLKPGQWILLDAERGQILEVDENLGKKAIELWQHKQEAGLTPKPLQTSLSPEMAQLRELIVPLNLTDAYGPTFSIMECRSLHDIVRYVHEKAVLEMFETGDFAVEEANRFVHRIQSNIPFQFFIIDLGGGLAPDVSEREIHIEDVRSWPFLHLWEGITTPGLRWSAPPPAANVSEIFSRAFLDQGSQRPIGSFNYALITSDYLNLNARVDYHFAMIDAVCGLNHRENHIRFRFKGGGTTQVQRERRVRFLADVLTSYDFFTDQQGDLITASIIHLDRDEIGKRLVMLGRLLGFSRLLDATMLDESTPELVAQAFLQGDYGLEILAVD